MKVWTINPYEFGEELRAQRKKLGLTQSELAKKVYWKSACSINNWEYGACLPNLASLIELAHVFGFDEVKIDTTRSWYV